MTNDCMANVQVTTICNLEGSGFGNTANEASDKRHQDMSGCRCKALEQAPNLKKKAFRKGLGFLLSGLRLQAYKF